MQIVGELINASRKAVHKAIESRDAAAIGKLAGDQKEAGADFIDVNAGVFSGRESEYLRWLIETVQGTVEGPCCIDSPDPKAIEEALSVHRGQAMINSISLEKERYEKLLPVLIGTDHKVVALCMSDEGMPETADQRLVIADKLINALVQNNIALANIYVDPLVQPVATNSTYGHEFMLAIRRIMTEYPGVHTICGLSNISYGLPERMFLNQVFLCMAMANGLDSAIINPLDRRMMANILAGEALIGSDSFCTNYLMGYRAGKLAL